MRFFSTKNREIHLGPYPLERLVRLDDPAEMGDLTAIPLREKLEFTRPEDPLSIINAMDEYQSMMDAIRVGITHPVLSIVPDDLEERSRHIKAFGYFSDASMVGCAVLPVAARLKTPYRNPGIDRLADDLRTKQVSTLASGIEVIMADLRETMEAAPTTIDAHTHAVVFIYEFPRDPEKDEVGNGWITDAQHHRAALRATETAAVIGNYFRKLGFDARSHSQSTSDVDLNRLAVAAGLCVYEDGRLVNPYLGDRFGIAAVTTNMALVPDKPLAPLSRQSWWKSHGPAWLIGKGTVKGAVNNEMFAKRRYVDGAFPFETLNRVDTPTTYIDEPNVARVPKRADMFARALFGDLGPAAQNGAKEGHYARKAPTSMAQRRALGAFILIQNGEPEPVQIAGATDPQANADNIKAACYFLGADAVGLSRCPDWAYYSHNAAGKEIDPYHANAVSIIIDQGFETMEGASGDDWISCAQSMRAYLRFSLLGGVLAKHIRNLGYSARAHTVMDGEVLQPPLLLLSGLGEVSRIGEVILNPFLGPRLKSGVVTTDMPMVHDKPIDFGLQKFCEQCNKCARECPSGAITAGPKLMFNGYEIWKSDSQKCASYRITAQGGAMCGRCMKTCPWNLEGLFADSAFRWMAMNVPAAAPALAKMDDMAGRGGLNPVKKWWWDLEWEADGAYRPTQHKVNERGLQRDLDLKYEDQTLAVYPANLAPHPYPFPFAMDREQGIEAYQAMVTADEYKRRLAAGDGDDLIHRYTVDGESPVLQVEITAIDKMTEGVTLYELRALDGGDLPRWEAGAHIDIVVAPEYLRQYSLTGDPADRSCYQIGVLREDEGKGGSRMLHRIFTQNRKIFISKPLNHFPLVEDAGKSYLMGGGIGITPMIAMANRLHLLGRDFAVHYSCRSRQNAGFLSMLDAVPWRDKLHLHFSDEDSRADLAAILADPAPRDHVYCCGPDLYMNAVMEAATEAGFDEDNRHLEYFSVPEQPEYENHDFTLHLAQSGRDITVPADRTAAEVLNENGFNIDIKCSDGICGVCKCGLISGDVEHRDFVLSNRQRDTTIILCQSRGTKDSAVAIDL
ncbi:reductive dehalogenase [Alphaproteobacteria bacterium]|nr:reductive dehalogenase [Alphaproteobacteria bacterium]